MGSRGVARFLRRARRILAESETHYVQSEAHMVGNCLERSRKVWPSPLPMARLSPGTVDGMHTEQYPSFARHAPGLTWEQHAAPAWPAHEAGLRVASQVRLPWQSASLVQRATAMATASLGSMLRIASCTWQLDGTVGCTSSSGSAMSASRSKSAPVWPWPLEKTSAGPSMPFAGWLGSGRAWSTSMPPVSPWLCETAPNSCDVPPQRLWRSTKPFAPQMLTGGGVGGGVGGGSGGGEGGGGDGGGEGGGEGGGGDGGGEGGGDGGGGEGGGDGGGPGGGEGGGERGEGAYAEASSRITVHVGRRHGIERSN